MTRNKKWDIITYSAVSEKMMIGYYEQFNDKNLKIQMEWRHSQKTTIYQNGHKKKWKI